MRLFVAPLALLVILLAACGEDEPPPESILPEKIVRADPLPPPVQGGTLEVQGDYAFASDPDRDRVWVIDLENEQVTDEIVLTADSEPGRIAPMSNGSFAVASRGRGFIAVIAADEGGDWGEVRRAQPCTHAEGVTYDEQAASLWVSCLSGKVVQLSADSLEEQQQTDLGPDIRDILVLDDLVYVSRFRKAEVVVLNRSLEEQEIMRPNARFRTTPSVAWRMRPHPRGGVLLAHQSASVGSAEDPLHLNFPTVYGNESSCSVAVVAASLSHLRVGEAPRGGRAIGNAVLPVDVDFDNTNVLSPKVIMAMAGNANLRQSKEAAIVVDDEGRALGNAQNREAIECTLTGIKFNDRRSIMAVAFSEKYGVVYQSRDPWLVSVGAAQITLPGTNLRDTGYTLFHTDAGKGIACASCHPMGRDDGLTWHFAGDVISGPRRTPYIRGGMSQTQPFHWSGDVNDFEVLLDEIFSRRMGGAQLDSQYAAVLGDYFDRIENLNSPFAEDTEQVARGREIFNRADTKCFTCHQGTLLTDNMSYDVGTTPPGEVLQVPRLHGLWVRAPYMHDGCANTLRERFTNEACGGTAHGDVSSLTEQELDDLVAFLKTL